MRSLRVAPRERLLFLHIPKTAGTSMRQYLRAQYRREDILPAINWTELAAMGLDPADYALFAGHFRANFRAAVPRETRTLTVLRDPVARYVSHLRHARTLPEFDVLHEAIRQMPLADIIRHPVFGPKWANGQTHWLAASAEPEAVARFLAEHPARDSGALEPDDETDDARLARAKRHLAEIDFVGFADDLDRFAHELAAQMLFHPPTEFPVKNISQDSEIGPHLHPEDRALIERLNEADIDLHRHAQSLVRAKRLRHAVAMLTRDGQYDTPGLPFALDLSAPMPGSGWHDYEVAGGTQWRWTDAEAGASMHIAQRLAGGTQCTIAFLGWGLPPAPLVSVSVNGTPRSVSLWASDEGCELRFAVCDAAAADNLICLNILHAPAPTAQDDPRSLGLAVTAVTFQEPEEPVGADSGEDA